VLLFCAHLRLIFTDMYTPIQHYMYFVERTIINHVINHFGQTKGWVRIITATPLNKQQDMVLKLRLVQKQNELLQE